MRRGWWWLIYCFAVGLLFCALAWALGYSLDWHYYVLLLFVAIAVTAAPFVHNASEEK